MNESFSLITVFLTGLLTGGLTCLAVQGGLLASAIAQRQTKGPMPVLSFLVAKLITYTLLGFLLGWFGSLFQLSLGALTILQLSVIIFMVGTALHLLNIHPVFRYFAIQPPRFITRFIRKEAKSGHLFAPLTLGAFTVFIPCGTTQAMMALAIATGNPLYGSLILFTFVLGTTPLFFILGYLAATLGDVFQKRFTEVAAYSLILLAMFNLNGALSLSGSLNPLTPSGNINNRSVETATIEFTQASYWPRIIELKAGSHVTLNLVNKSGAGCIQAFTIPDLGLQKIVPIGKTEKLTFTAPVKKGKIEFMCSMGMYRGTINII